MLSTHSRTTQCICAVSLVALGRALLVRRFFFCVLDGVHRSEEVGGGLHRVRDRLLGGRRARNHGRTRGSPSSFLRLTSRRLSFCLVAPLCPLSLLSPRPRPASSSPRCHSLARLTLCLVPLRAATEPEFQHPTLEKLPVFQPPGECSAERKTLPLRSPSVANEACVALERRVCELTDFPWHLCRHAHAASLGAQCALGCPHPANSGQASHFSARSLWLHV